MPTYDIDGYLQQAGTGTDVEHERRRHLRMACITVLSVSTIVVFCEVIVGGLSPWSVSREPRAQLPRTLQSSTDNLVAWLSSSQSGKQQPDFRGVFGMIGPRVQLRGGVRPQDNVWWHPREPMLRGAGRDVLTQARYDDVSERMLLPLESFGGLSPERKAAQQLQRFFTFVAFKVVLHQLEGAQQNDFEELFNFYQTEPLKDADDWVQKLMDRNQKLAFRIMEVRKAYAEQDFEWASLQTMAVQGLTQGNEKVMKVWAEKSFALPEYIHM